MLMFGYYICEYESLKFVNVNANAIFFKTKALFIINKVQSFSI